MRMLCIVSFTSNYEYVGVPSQCVIDGDTSYFALEVGCT